ncbi:MAG: hypothetical protein IJH47_03015 [Oscillospiraceae bacterium]|nr:hypothetical protein [Oscillospiraceae bacterium]
MKKTHLLILPALALLFTAGAPAAASLELSTPRETMVDGMLSAKDADGHVYFVVTTEPRKGLLRLYPDGSFLYTPAERARGRDYFGYRAVDESGARSEEATVIIRITR